MEMTLIYEMPHATINCPYCNTKETVDFKAEDYSPFIQKILARGGLTISYIPYKCPWCKNISSYDLCTKQLNQLPSKEQDYHRSFFPFKTQKFAGAGPYKDLPSFADVWLNLHTEQDTVRRWWVFPDKEVHYVPTTDIHGDFARKHLGLFGIDSMQQVKNYCKGIPGFYAKTEDPIAITTYIVDTGRGVRCSVAGYQGAVQGHPTLINHLKDTIYDELLDYGASVIYVDTPGKQNRLPVDLDKFRKIRYLS